MGVLMCYYPFYLADFETEEPMNNESLKASRANIVSLTE